MGLFNKKNKDGNLTALMSHYAGLPNVKENIPFNITLDENAQTLIFKESANKQGITITLNLSKITNVDYVDIEYVKGSNAVKRAIAGGLLFGNAGAIVGALTAKDKTKKVYYRKISYISDGVENEIFFKSGTLPGENTLFKKLSELVNTTPKKEFEL